jgi:hypothetical protein
VWVESVGVECECGWRVWVESVGGECGVLSVGVGVSGECGWRAWVWVESVGVNGIRLVIVDRSVRKEAQSAGK